MFGIVGRIEGKTVIGIGIGIGIRRRVGLMTRGRGVSGIRMQVQLSAVGLYGGSYCILAQLGCEGL